MQILSETGFAFYCASIDGKQGLSWPLWVSTLDEVKEFDSQSAAEITLSLVNGYAGHLASPVIAGVWRRSALRCRLIEQEIQR